MYIKITTCQHKTALSWRQRSFFAVSVFSFLLPSIPMHINFLDCSTMTNKYAHYQNIGLFSRNRVCLEFLSTSKWALLPVKSERNLLTSNGRTIGVRKFFEIAIWKAVDQLFTFHSDFDHATVAPGSVICNTREGSFVLEVDPVKRVTDRFDSLAENDAMFL